jgi:uncharacterized protein (DUF885 family)
MRNLILFTAVLLIGCSSQVDIGIDMESPSETEKFHALLDREWKKGIINNPEWATRLGDNRFNDKLNDVSYETIVKRQGETRDLLIEVQDINRSKLPDDILNYDLYLNGINRRIEGFEFLSYLMPIDQMGGIQIGFAGISDYMPFKTVQDYENYISRMEAFPGKITQTIDLMKRGIESGWVPPKIVLRAVPDQIQSQFNKPIVESPLYKPFKEFPESIPLDTQKRLLDEAERVLSDDVYSAYRSLFTYFNDFYLPACRESIACREFPNGAEYYRYQIKSYTTTDLTAEEIHHFSPDSCYFIQPYLMYLFSGQICGGIALDLVSVVFSTIREFSAGNGFPARRQIEVVEVCKK